MFTLTICFIIFNASIEFVLIYRPHPVCMNKNVIFYWRRNLEGIELFCRDHRGQRLAGCPCLASCTQCTAELKDRARWPGFVLCTGCSSRSSSAERALGARYCFCTQRIIFTKIMRSMQGQYSRVSNDIFGVGTRKNRRYRQRNIVGTSIERAQGATNKIVRTWNSGGNRHERLKHDA